MRAVLTILGLTADEFAEELVALVAQLLMNANLGSVVALNRRLLGHDKEHFQRRLRRALVAADILEDRVQLRGVQPAEWGVESRRGLGVERGETAEPLEGALALRFAEQEIDVLGDTRLLRTGRMVVGWD